MDHIEENHKRYLERLKFYQSFGYDMERERDFIIDKSLPITGKVLEIGTGKGHFALALAKRGYSFITVDLSPEEQEIARLNIRYYGFDRRVKFIIADARKLEFPDRSFDTIFSINVFHHLKDPMAVLDEMRRLLRPAGRIILGDFNQKGFEIINACHEREGRVHDRSRHDLGEAKDYFIAHGFRVEEFHSQAQNMMVARSKPVLASNP